MQKPSLVVGSRKGEEALSILNEISIVDHHYKIRHSKDKLLIPLLRRPEKEELEIIEDRVGPFSIGEDEYEQHQKRYQSLDDALSLLPPEIQSEVPRSFDIIGDIAVLELSPATEAFQTLIASALMEVHPNVSSVYGKAGPISGVERVRPLKHLAGEDRTVTVHREYGCNFQVDIAKAYYSPRLSEEHKRVADQVRPGEHVLDMFAGVGPFTILIARRVRDVEVDAVDVNPEAAKLLAANIDLNRLKGNVHVWNKDVKEVVRDALFGRCTRAIMNHPSQAKEFVPTACEAMSQTGGIIHYYTFNEGPDAEARSVAELEERLESIDWNIEQTLVAKRVKGISPMSWQVAVDALVSPS